MNEHQGQALGQYRLRLPPAVVNDLRRLAITETERRGRFVAWGSLVREALTRLVQGKGPGR